MCILCKIYVSIYRVTSERPIRSAHFAQIQYLQGFGVLHYTKMCIFPVTFFMKVGEQLERDLYFLMYQTIWKFHKKYINNISGDNAFWDEVILYFISIVLCLCILMNLHTLCLQTSLLKDCFFDISHSILPRSICEPCLSLEFY